MTLRMRNFVGGFFGGIIGILACWYIHPSATPLGIIGAILGFWPMEIVQKTISFSGAAWSFFRNGTFVPKFFRRTSYEWSDVERFQRCRSYSDICFFGINMLLVGMVGWSMIISHFFTLPSFLLGVLICSWIEITMINTHVDSQKKFDASLVDYDLFREHPYRIMGRYLLSFLLNEAWRLGRSFSITMYWSAVVCVCIVSAGVLGAVLIPIFAPLAALVALSRCSEHWFCCTVVLCVTGITAFLGYGVWTHPLQVWLCAFACGMVSGCISAAFHARVRSFSLSLSKIVNVAKKFVDEFLNFASEVSNNILCVFDRHYHVTLYSRSE
jgi:hypothetical protein